MRSLTLVALLACSALTAYGATQAVKLEEPDISAQANTMQREGLVTRLLGNVVVTTGGIVLEADEVNIRSDSRELEARGNVSVRPFMATASSGSAQALDAVIISLQKELQELNITLTAENPKVKHLQQQIWELEGGRNAAVVSSLPTWSFRTDSLKMQLPPATR